MSLVKMIKIGYLCMETDELLDAEDCHLLRGSIAGIFPNERLLHNHNEQGKEIYRYPKIQYKIVDGFPMVIAIGNEAIEVLKRVCKTIVAFEFDNGKSYDLLEKRVEIEEHPFGVSDTIKGYYFLTPAILLNSNNYDNYQKLEDENKKNEFISGKLAAHLLSTSKGMEYTVLERIKISCNLKTLPVILKGEKMIGFTGFFYANFYIPDFLGVGKSTSRGYGVCISNDD